MHTMRQLEGRKKMIARPFYLLAWQEVAEHDREASSRGLRDGARASLGHDTVDCSHPFVHIGNEPLQENGNTRTPGATTQQNVGTGSDRKNTLHFDGCNMQCRHTAQG